MGGFAVYLLSSVGIGVLVVIPDRPLSAEPALSPVSVSFPVVSLLILKSGEGDALAKGVVVGIGGTVASGQGDAVTLPFSVVLPQALSNRLSRSVRTRYAKDLFISILLSVFARLLSPACMRFIH